MASQYYNLCWASGKGIERSVTESINDARVMARVMSKSSEHQPSQTIMIVDDKAKPIEFIHDGVRFVNEATLQVTV